MLHKRARRNTPTYNYRKDYREERIHNKTHSWKVKIRRLRFRSNMRSTNSSNITLIKLHFYLIKLTKVINAAFSQVPEQDLATPIPAANQAKKVPHIPPPGRDWPQVNSSPRPKRKLQTHKPNITEYIF